MGNITPSANNKILHSSDKTSNRGFLPPDADVLDEIEPKTDGLLYLKQLRFYIISSPRDANLPNTTALHPL